MAEDRLHATERAEGFVVGNLFTLCQVLDTDKSSFQAKKNKKDRLIFF